VGHCSSLGALLQALRDSVFRKKRDKMKHLSLLPFLLPLAISPSPNTATCAGPRNGAFKNDFFLSFLFFVLTDGLQLAVTRTKSGQKPQDTVGIIMHFEQSGFGLLGKNMGHNYSRRRWDP
jgi:hypothetical protein